MKRYQVRSMLNQIASHTYRLSLPLSDIDCVIYEHRRALYLDIVRAIDDLYVSSFIDSFMRVQLSHRAELAYIYGGSP